MGQECPPQDPRHGRLLTGHNVWPDESVLAASDFKEPVTTYYAALLEITLKILEILAATLPYGPDVFKTFVADMPAAPMRLLHYPPKPITTDEAPVVSNGEHAERPPQKKKKQLGASAHTDFGAITLLLQDSVPGLQVLDQDAASGHATTDDDSRWFTVPPRSDAFVVNLGDMMTRWTQGEYKSSVHHVINNGGQERYSIAFFFDGNIDCRLDPLGGDAATNTQHDGITVEQHMLECLRKSYAPKE